jgi:LmbE family N-acetylglucosaminyl deacetylase
MKRKIVGGGMCLFLALLGAAALAEPTLGDIAKHQDALDAGTDLRLMCVAAHPDDEDGATLAMYRKKYGYKTFAVLATRGEGGQNEIGPELYEQLAVLRTDEMSRASAFTGAELHFLNLPEFGYSKTKEEAFAIWGYDKAFERMVRKIRELRPDVIITHHPPQGQHGHHQAIGQVLQDAFDKAGDPAVCPEQIKEGLQPWQPARLYLRSFQGGGELVRINFNELDPVRGLTYAQIAANALREHKTQGMGFFIDRFLTSRSTASYGLVKDHKEGTQGGGDVAAPGGGLFEGLRDRVSADARKLSLAGAESLDTAKAVALLKAARAQDPAGAAAERANRLAGAMAELRVTAKPSDAEVVAGQEIKLAVEAIDFGAQDATNVTFEVRAKPWFAAAAPAPLTQTFSGGFSTAEFTLRAPSDQARTLPYSEFVYQPHYLEPQIVVTATADVGGTPVTVEAPVYLEIAPAAALEFLHAPYLIRPVAGDTAEFTLLVTNHAAGAGAATIQLSATKGLTLEQDTVSVTFAREGDQKVIPIRARVAKGLAPGDYPLTAKVAETGHSLTGLVRYVNVQVPKDRRVGVIRSYDDTLLITLDRLGVPYDTIETADFTPESLDRFTTILVDIRAYLDRPDLVANNQTLLDYCKRGGTVIVNYHKTIEWESAYAPYELVVGGQRVTVETAPITILQPEHPLFNVPNKIVPADWDNWIQERGLYFPSKWAPEYTPLISVSDPGEAPLQGSCLIAKYGEGTYLYTSLVWYRQLRAMNPGAIRIFANMLAL